MFLHVIYVLHCLNYFPFLVGKILGKVRAPHLFGEELKDVLMRGGGPWMVIEVVRGMQGIMSGYKQW